MNVQRICTYAVVFSFTTGCASSLSQKDFEHAEQDFVILEQAVDRVRTMFLAILAQLHLGRASSCPRKAKEVGLSPSSQRSQMLTRAVEKIGE